MPGSSELRDVLWADAVVIGRVKEYEVVNPWARRPLAGYAVFTIDLSRVVHGEVSVGPDNEFMFVWNSSFTFPKEFDRETPHLFALLDPNAPLLPRENSDPIFFGSPRKDMMIVLQEPCAEAFIYKEEHPASRMIQQALESGRDPELELDILREYHLRTLGLRNRFEDAETWNYCWRNLNQPECRSER